MWLRFQIGSNMPLAKAQHQDVLHRLLAEVVIDPVDLVLVDDSEQFVVERLGGGEVGAERLSITSRRHAPPSSFSKPVRPSSLTIGAKAAGGARQIKQAAAAGRAVRLQFLEPLGHRV